MLLLAFWGSRKIHGSRWPVGPTSSKKQKKPNWRSLLSYHTISHIISYHIIYHIISYYSVLYYIVLYHITSLLSHITVYPIIPINQLRTKTPLVGDLFLSGIPATENLTNHRGSTWYFVVSGWWFGHQVPPAMLVLHLPIA